ncbi:hypothetical protein VU08_01315 [Desulfobulbus sp. F5]|nr:hypothetical protein [Desulfobulbus sp. F5]
MASQNDQRATDFEEVKRILEQQPRITLMQTEGEPPDCYEIEYRLAGMVRDADGTIRKASQHVILVTLPFGYPHFPPTVKPLTPLFHPDIDPDAVRISSHWQQSPSLAKLIVQVGEMICGKNYNLEDPFNQEAADWYAQHATELPLDSLEVASDESIDEFDLGLDDLDLGPTGGTTEEQSFELSLELESPQAVHDVLADASADHQGGGTGGLSLELESSSTTLEEDFDLGVEDGQEDDLSLDIGEPETPPQVVQQDFGPKLKEIRSHIDRKEIFIAARLLKEVPALPETEILKKKVKAAQDKCDELLQNMKVLEDEDNFAAAQEVFTQLKTVAVDTPGLAEIGRRLQQSQSMLDTFALTKEKTEPETELPGAEKKKKKSAKETPPPPPKPKEKPAEPKEKKEVIKTKSRIIRAAQQNVPVAPFAAAAAVAAVIIVGGLIYTRDSNTLLEAQRDWQEAQGLVKQKNFPQAEAKINIASAALKTVLTPLPEKSRIKTEIAALFANEDFQRGLKNEAKYKDQYLPLQEVKAREQLDKMTAQAEALKANSVSDAAAAYEKAQSFAAESGLVVEAEQLKERVHQLRMKEALVNAGRAETAGEWENAAKTYQQALEIAQTLTDDKEKEAISKRLAAAAFNRELDQSKKSFTGSQWQQTIEMLERAKKLLEQNPETATVERRQELERLLAKSRLHQVLSTARQAYDSGDTATAVRGYRQSLALLTDQLSLFDETDRNAAHSISRTITMIEIGGELNAAVTAENQKELTDALRHYRAIQNLFNTPRLTKDSRLLTLEENVNAKVSSLSSEAGMKRKTAWLNRNFRRIFMEVYPNSRPTDLSNPNLSLVKKIGNQEIYKLTCTERSRGSAYQLELIYLYDPVADQWIAYRGEL